DDRPVERWTIGGRYDNHRCGLDHRPGLNRDAGEHSATARGAGADLDTVVRYRPQAACLRRGDHLGRRVQACSRGRSAAAAGAAVLAAAAGGGTCAGGAVSVSSSSFIPALKALIPLAKSPITRGSFPAPKRIRIMAKTTIQCIKLKEPIAATLEG